jgi:hypothetical protein
MAEEEKYIVRNGCFITDRGIKRSVMTSWKRVARVHSIIFQMIPVVLIALMDCPMTHGIKRGMATHALIRLFHNAFTVQYRETNLSCRLWEKTKYRVLRPNLYIYRAEIPQPQMLCPGFLARITSLLIMIRILKTFSLIATCFVPAEYKTVIHLPRDSPANRKVWRC